jgi:S-adenosylmethionine decarboxylase
LETLFPQFTFDTHLFEPYGFSMNGLWGEYYITLHITPQAGQTYACSYVSFETNLDLSRYPQAILGRLLNLFSPVSWDLIGFNHPLEVQGVPKHLCLGRCSLTTDQGYHIGFNHYQQLQAEELSPEPM